MNSQINQPDWNQFFLPVNQNLLQNGVEKPSHPQNISLTSIIHSNKMRCVICEYKQMKQKHLVQYTIIMKINKIYCLYWSGVNAKKHKPYWFSSSMPSRCYDWAEGINECLSWFYLNNGVIWFLRGIRSSRWTWRDVKLFLIL